MKTQSAVDEYLVEIEVRKYTPKTIRSYRCNLNLFLRFCAEKLHVETVEALTPAVVRQFSRCMSEAGRKGTYINGVLKSIKSFIQYCYEEGYGGFDTRKTFKWCKEEKPVITAFSPEQVRSMLQSCRGHDYLSLRDYAILTLLFETGICCWELCCIREEDIHNDFIIINGKNHKQRVVPITPVLKKAMLRYESGKEKYFMLRPHDAFYFLSFHGRQLTDGAVEYVLRKRGEGIEGVRVSPHTCRHFFAQQQVKMGTDLYTISRLLGHENIGITQTLCSTGDINAQFKGKDVFTFKPSHSIVLCTNHMPSVKVMDSGTWDRLIVVPFRGRFRSQENEIKNYGNYLVRACGGAILSWIIDGAREYIRNDYKLDIPECIISATEQYQQENDWLTDFFNEWVALDKNEDTYGSDIYEAYTSFCSEHGERMLPMSSVLPLVETKAGATKKRTKKGNVYQGLRIISEFERAAS